MLQWRTYMPPKAKSKKNSAVTASRLRADVYRILDRVIETGVPAEIARKGRILRIVSDRPASRLDRLQVRPGYIKGDPDRLIHVDWSGTWRP
jgi:hypothetical protein